MTIHYYIKPGDTIHCPVCGKAHVAKVRMCKPTCCSKQCSKLKAKQTILAKPKKKLKPGRVRAGDLIQCPICGKQFISKYKGTIRCCSKECTKVLKSTKIKAFYIKNPKPHKTKQTYYEKTGYTHPLLNPKDKEIIINKTKNTKLKRYGNENYNNREKANQTCLERYGTAYPSDLPEFINKSKQTKLERYGNETYTNKEKQKQTCLERYGVENASQSKEIREKIKQNNLKKYGVENTAQLPETQEKIRQTLLKKTGYEYAAQNPETLEKIRLTKHKNGTFNTSSDENIIYEKLKLIFHDLKTQYKSDSYPFCCDFYIPELDLYIEYQGDWKHGKSNKNKIYGPYDLNNPKHKAILAKWQEKASQGKPQYKSAIKVWTISDPLKREIAKQNDLNWIEFFTIDEFELWLNQYK